MPVAAPGEHHARVGAGEDLEHALVAILRVARPESAHARSASTPRVGERVELAPAPAVLLVQ